MLDQFQNQYDKMAAPQPGEGTDLPPTFGESFQDAWQNGQMAVSGIKQANARSQAVNEYVDQIKAAGGDVDAAYAKQLAEAGNLGEDQMGNPVQPDLLDVANGVVAKMKASADAPGKTLPFQPMTSGDIDNRAVQISQAAIGAHAATLAKPQTWGSWAGRVLGETASATVDPYNLPALAVLVEGLGILGTAAAFGGVNAATQAAARSKTQPTTSGLRLATPTAAPRCRA